MIHRTLIAASIIAFAFVASACSRHSAGSSTTTQSESAQASSPADYAATPDTNATPSAAPSANGEMVHGKVDLPVYPGAVAVEKAARAFSGGLAYHYQSNDSVETVSSWYKDKLAGAEERMHIESKAASFATAGSQAVNVMVVLAGNGKTDIILSPQ